MIDIVLGIAVTAHLNMAGNFNDTHPFIEAQYENYSVGAYTNSLYGTSTYAKYTFTYTNNSFIDIGVVTGYPAPNDIPVIPYYRMGYNLTQSTAVFTTPTWQDNKLGAVLGFEVKF